jgi:hypothetical protein
MASYVLNFTRSGTKDKQGMPAQARQLLEAGFWGIPPTAQLKGKIVAGDRVLAFVGAPDRVFVGDAVVKAGYHAWTPEEAAVYPGTFEQGIALADARIWIKPVPIGSVWPQSQGFTTNPKPLWYGALASLSESDANLITKAGTSEGAASSGGAASSPLSTPPASSTDSPAPDGVGLGESEALYLVGQRLQKFLANPKPINEDGTRAFFIDKILDALGYSDFDEIEHGSSQASGTFPDYILRAGGKRAIAVEAKRLGAALGEKEAAQLVSYCSVVGVRWGILTDGRQLQVYDAPVVGASPIDRLVLQIDLAEFADRDDFDTRLWPAAATLTRLAMASGDELERHAARELIRTILADPSSASVISLQQELQSRKVLVSAAETAVLLSELIG